MQGNFKTSWKRSRSKEKAHKIDRQANWQCNLFLVQDSMKQERACQQSFDLGKLYFQFILRFNFRRKPKNLQRRLAKIPLKQALDGWPILRSAILLHSKRRWRRNQSRWSVAHLHCWSFKSTGHPSIIYGTKRWLRGGQINKQG